MFMKAGSRFVIPTAGGINARVYVMHMGSPRGQGRENRFYPAVRMTKKISFMFMKAGSPFVIPTAGWINARVYVMHMGSPRGQGREYRFFPPVRMTK